MRILLVDDDDLLTQTLTSFLVSQRYAVDVAADGETGWNYAQAATYDLIVLDINLPRLDGIRLCQRLRQSRYSCPILLLTAKGADSDKVVGLDAGADDYLVKPCTPQELAARIRALLRRQHPFTTPVLSWGEICFDPGTCEVTYQGQLLSLSPKEYGLLELFLRNPQRIFSSSSILEHLWGFEDTPGEETVRTHIKRLRRKFKAVGLEDLIDNVYGMGYRLTPLPSPSQIPDAATLAHQARSAVIALWKQFQAPTLERLVILDEALAALRQGNLPDELRQAAILNAHKLSGSLGMFGFPVGSHLSQQLEAEFRHQPVRVNQLADLVAQLHQELQKSPQPSTAEQATFPAPPVPVRPVLGQLLPHPANRVQTERSSQVKVLAVDDDHLVLETLQQFLPRWGIAPIVLNNPLHLWDTLQRERPDLVILDVDMPEMNGIELCRLIRNSQDWYKLPILFLSAHRDPELSLQLYSAGADDYVAKPFTEPEVVTRILNRLERNRLLNTVL